MNGKEETEVQISNWSRTKTVTQLGGGEKRKKRQLSEFLFFNKTKQKTKQNKNTEKTTFWVSLAG